ncbi:hypothetical protein PPERSA_09319 [Pseudocohnilembus persalinus]|uniref:Uncharacterized protein n=1 Tax=Pseudocohnilembus persalinus TaxID=266149 RepID=A0A0V0R582_PSEPJ|nr:hypothetical protein PPERSA_09319 [Pseudocohnilembus persalinus]|eukprot:KRX09649.1 hypothetical protein PPERSA_09319 [Pseudocohnilembus persalinus]
MSNQILQFEQNQSQIRNALSQNDSSISDTGNSRNQQNGTNYTNYSNQNILAQQKNHQFQPLQKSSFNNNQKTNQGKIFNETLQKQQILQIKMDQNDTPNQLIRPNLCNKNTTDLQSNNINITSGFQNVSIKGLIQNNKNEDLINNKFQQGNNFNKININKQNNVLISENQQNHKINGSFTQTAGSHFQNSEYYNEEEDDTINYNLHMYPTPIMMLKQKPKYGILKNANYNKNTNNNNKKIRQDKYGHKINENNNNNHTISFKDRLVEVKFVDNWKEYNFTEDEDSGILICCNLCNIC